MKPWNRKPFSTGIKDIKSSRSMVLKSPASLSPQYIAFALSCLYPQLSAFICVKLKDFGFKGFYRTQIKADERR